jgi:hypothetical protein
MQAQEEGSWDEKETQVGIQTGQDPVAFLQASLASLPGVYLRLPRGTPLRCYQTHDQGFREVYRVPKSTTEHERLLDRVRSLANDDTMTLLNLVVLL